MLFKKVMILVAVVVLPSLCIAHIGGYSKAQDTDPHFYCGRNLARILATICYEDVNKRSGNFLGNGYMYDMMLTPYYKEQEAAWPWMPHHKARELNLFSEKRGKRSIPGVVSECCDKACSISELMTYC